jgi:ABC-type nitrate/sulfonate/bicarbonate transport system permease component
MPSLFALFLRALNSSRLNLLWLVMTPRPIPLVLQTIDIGSGKGIFVTVVLELFVGLGVQVKVGAYPFAAIRKWVDHGLCRLR